MSNKGYLDAWQYRISDGGRIVDVGPDIDQVQIEDEAGRPVGVLLGFPVDLKRQVRLTGGIHRVAARFDEDVDAFADAVLEELAGRFLWLCSLGGVARIYLDAAGQVPCVFDPAMKIAASSAHALLADDEYVDRFDAALHDRLGVGGLGWIPGGLTAHRGVQRLLPNHRLDLSDFSVARHWPLGPVGQGEDPAAEIGVIVETVRAQMAALADSGRKVAQALTAGRETRMLLGCARSAVADIEFVTVSGDHGHVDSVMAARIASGEGLQHRILAVKTASDTERRDYLRRNGDCIADANADTFPSVAPLARSHVFIGGAGGEVGRGFFWRPSDKPDTPLDGAALMGRFGLPAEPAVIAALDQWLAGLDGRSTLEILDLAYIEQRMGPWGGAQFPSDPTLVRFAPLLTRAGVRAMMRLPEEWKRAEGMSEAVLEATWPELARYPFNTLGPWRDRLGKLKKALRDPGVIVRKLRKRFG